MPLTKLGRGGGVALAVDLLNSWDELEPDPELLGVRWLRFYLDFHGYGAAAAKVREPDVPVAKELRERLRQAFDATSEEEAVATLNGVLADYAGPPRLERTPKGWRFRYGPDETAGIEFLAAPTAVALLEAIRDHGLSRFGRCSAHPCRCVFVDRSRNRSRRYCCDLCADRANQAAARDRRRRQKGGGASVR
jgi:predicted RNA-binding Zn ribbon-like protein